jgi:predicted RNase H-like HicB family nuclease
MSNSHAYTAAVIPIQNGYMGFILEVPGAMSFAKTEKELMQRLMDAVNCVHEFQKAKKESSLKSEGLNNFNQMKFATVPCY